MTILFAKKSLHTNRSMYIIEIRYLCSSFNDFAIKNLANFVALPFLAH